MLNLKKNLDSVIHICFINITLLLGTFFRRILYVFLLKFLNSILLVGFAVALLQLSSYYYRNLIIIIICVGSCCWLEHLCQMLVSFLYRKSA